MGNSLRCCLACVLPCGALDVIRIVHLNGYVEEITRVITVGEVLGSYPNHVLSKPYCQGMVRKIVILSPQSELKRGSIYFLIPDSSLPSAKSSHSNSKTNIAKNKNKNVKHQDIDNNRSLTNVDLCTLDDGESDVVVSDVTNSDSKSKSKSGKNRRRRSSRGSKSGTWHPHLQSITEDF